MATYIFAPDLHWPESDRPTVNALFDFLGRNKIDGFIFGGDQFNNDAISHHNANRPLRQEKGAYLKDEQSFDKEILKPLDKLLGKAEKVWIVGNHDVWETDIAETSPALLGTTDRVRSLNLKARGWKVIPQGGEFRKGHLTTIHGDVLTGANHAKKALDVFGTNILYGHFHSPVSATKIMSVGQKQKHQAWCSPILGNVNPRYRKSAPSGWLNGFTIIEFHPNGNFNVFPVVVTNGVFYYGGKCYGKKGRKAV
jgi:hypothetical protein